MHFYPNDTSNAADVAAAQRGYGTLMLSTFPPCVSSSSYVETSLILCSRCLYVFMTDFWYGWFLDPIFKGDYPKTMRDTVGARLPTFTPEQIKVQTLSLLFSLFL